MVNEVDLGEALKAARKKAGLTQQQLCQKTGISYSTLAKIERGAIKSPSVFTVHTIAQVVGTTLNDLMGEVTTDMPQPKTLRSKSGVRFVFFDVNGCLVRFYHRAFTRIAQDSGKQADLIETAFWHYNDAVCRGELSIDEFNRLLGERFEMGQFDWRTYYLEAIEPIHEMHELLRWASSLYKVGLLTNIMPGQIEAMIKKGLVPDLPYAAIIDSSEVKAIKPEAEIYQVAATKTGCNPDEILLVDDSRSNVMAAEHAGWKVLWFDDYRPDESVARVRAALEPEI